MRRPQTNRYGLRRHIPEKVKRQVRTNSKHGCVICRALPYDYEHFDPEFQDATVHDPNGICLLCPRCHGEVTRGRIAKEYVRAAYTRLRADPEVAPPFYDARLSGSLRLTLGDSEFTSMPADACVLAYDRDRILQIGYVRDEVLGGSRPSMTGTLQDIEARELMRFEDNRITLAASGADVSLEGRQLTISGPSGIALQVTFDPPSGIRINRLRMRYRDLVCEFDHEFGVTYPSGAGGFERCLASINAAGAHAAISYTSRRARWNLGQLSMNGGEGIRLPYSGLTLGRGAGSMHIRRIVYWSNLPSPSA